MTVTLQPTSLIVELNGVPARVWEGQTSSGIRCHVFITRIAVRKGLDASEFERELLEQRPPSAEIVAAYPTKMVL